MDLMENLRLVWNLNFIMKSFIELTGDILESLENEVFGFKKNIPLVKFNILIQFQNNDNNYINNIIIHT